MTDTTTRASRRTAKPGGRKTANRFAKLAGGDDVSDPSPTPTTETETAGESGLIAGMSAFAADEAHRVVEIAVADIAPHPFNDDTRSQPHPGEAKSWSYNAPPSPRPDRPQHKAWRQRRDTSSSTATAAALPHSKQGAPPCPPWSTTWS
jgi:hypothetical protein